MNKLSQSNVTTLSVTFEFPNQKAVSVEGALSGGKASEILLMACWYDA